MPDAGRLMLAATPIGQARDASPRLRDALAETPVIAAEDTRRLRRLCRDLDISPLGRIVSYFDGNEQARVPGLLAALQDGEDVLVVTDAGMPTISDPGFRLVVAAVAAGVPVTALPGPSAVTTALALSGLPVDRYCFEGFLPRRVGERRRALAALADEARTMVFFESPRRLAACLDDLVSAFGAERAAAVCRELTKTYEQVRRGSLGELTDWAAGDIRGELTLVVAGRSAQTTAAPDPVELVRLVGEREAAGVSRRDAIAAVAAQLGRRRREVYNAVVGRVD